MTVEIFLYPLAFLYGLFSSYYELKSGKVPNTITITAILCALALYLAIICKHFVTGIPFNESFFVDTFLNVFFALVVSYLLYRLGVFSAGAGKAVIAYAFLIPVSVYSFVYIWPYPGLFHLGFSYLLVMAYYTVRAIVESRNALIESLRIYLSPKSLVFTFFSVLVFASLFSTFFKYAEITPTPFINLLLVLSISFFLSRVREVFKYFAFLGIIAFVHTLVFDPLRVLSIFFITAAVAPLIVFLYVLSRTNIDTDAEKTAFSPFLFLGFLLVVALHLLHPQPI